MRNPLGKPMTLDQCVFALQNPRTRERAYLQATRRHTPLPVLNAALDIVLARESQQATTTTTED